MSRSTSGATKLARDKNAVEPNGSRNDDNHDSNCVAP